jgi:hypothetical protein
VWVPTPASDGENVEPTTPGPEKTPPPILGIREVEDEFVQYDVFKPENPHCAISGIVLMVEIPAKLMTKIKFFKFLM